MRHVMFGLAFVVVCAGALPSARADRSSDDRLVGAWTGTYDGDSTGKFTMSISRDAAGKLAGTLEVAPDEGGGYTATFKTIAVDGDAVTLAYDSPGDGRSWCSLMAPSTARCSKAHGKSRTPAPAA